MQLINLPLWRMTVALFITVLAYGCTTIPTHENEGSAEESRWKKLGPGGGGSTFQPVFASGDPDHFIVRCDMTGTYITRDGGASYDQVNLPNGSATYAYHPSKSNIIYLATSALFRSEDSGRSWTQLLPHPSTVSDSVYRGDHASFQLISSDTLFNAETGPIAKIYVDPAAPDRVFFARGKSLFSSQNEGHTWTRIPLEEPASFLYTNKNAEGDTLLIFTENAVYHIDKNTHGLKKHTLPHEMAPAFSFTGGRKAGSDETIFYALHNRENVTPGEGFGETEVWTSRDGGRQWQKSDDAISNNRQNGIAPSYVLIAAAENDAGHAYLVTDRYMERDGSGTSVHWYGALKTADGGQQWQWVWKGGGGSGQYGVKDGKGVANLKDAWTEEAFGGEYIRLLEAGVYPDNGNIAVVTDWYRTMKTTDGGKTWEEVYSIRKEDGSYVSRGLDVTTAYGVHFDPFDKNHIAISYTDIGYHHSFNGGETWLRSVEGVPGEWVNTCYWMVFDPNVKDKMWSGWSNLHDFPRGKMARNPQWKSRAKGGVCLSTDGGRTWSPSNEGMGFDAPTTSLVMDPNSPPGNRTLYAAVYNKGVFKSVDDGKTWTLQNNGLGDNVAAFELTLLDNGHLFLTVVPTPVHRNGKAGTAFHSGAVYKSVDGAEHWTKLNVTDGLLFPNGIAADPNDANRIYLACWADITLSDLVGGGVVRTHGEENRTLDMPGGIFLSEDGGETWSSIFDQNQYVYDVSVDPAQPGRLYCNTFNQSAWRSDNYGKTWQKLPDYDFHWGHRVIPDPNQAGKIYITTYGSSVLVGEVGN